MGFVNSQEIMKPLTDFDGTFMSATVSERDARDAMAGRSIALV